MGLRIDSQLFWETGNFTNDGDEKHLFTEAMMMKWCGFFTPQLLQSEPNWKCRECRRESDDNIGCWKVVGKRRNGVHSTLSSTIWLKISCKWQAETPKALSLYKIKPFSLSTFLPCFQISHEPWPILICYCTMWLTMNPLHLLTSHHYGSWKLQACVVTVFQNSFLSL